MITFPVCSTVVQSRTSRRLRRLLNVTRNEDEEEESESEEESVFSGYTTVVNDHVIVTGVGFFDKIHGQTGVAPNGIELHPVLSISWDK